MDATGQFLSFACGPFDNTRLYPKLPRPLFLSRREQVPNHHDVNMISDEILEIASAIFSHLKRKKYYRVRVLADLTVIRHLFPILGLKARDENNSARESDDYHSGFSA